MKTAFYPCCADDIEEPLTHLKGYADKIIFWRSVRACRTWATRDSQAAVSAEAWLRPVLAIA
jgi:hypothetical protein